MDKIILIDHGILCHKSIFDWGGTYKKILDGILPKSTFLPPVGYTYMSMLISALKKVGVKYEDKVIIGMDGYDSWRKNLLASYKSQRKAYRESHEHINWKQKYGEINKVIEQLKEATNFYFIQIPSIEYDDIASVAVRKFKDHECVIISGDQDLEQLAYFKNVKVFSLFSKYKGQKGSYKVIKQPLKVLHDKLKKGDVSDNIKVSVTDTEYDYEIRNTIMNLLELPKEIEEKIEPHLNLNGNRKVDYSKLPFPNSLAKRFPEIYTDKNVITYEQVEKYQENKKRRKKNASNENKRKKVKK